MITDDEVWKLWAQTHPDTERGHSDVALFDFVQEIWDRAFEAGKEHMWARTQGEYPEIP